MPSFKTAAWRPPRKARTKAGPSNWDQGTALPVGVAEGSHTGLDGNSSGNAMLALAGLPQEGQAAGLSHFSCP